MNVYSLFDRKVKLFGQLVLERNDFALQRGLVDSLRGSPDTLLAKHPEDFDLYRVGDFNDETGELTSSTRLLVCCVADLVVDVPARGDPSRLGASLSKEG